MTTTLTHSTNLAHIPSTLRLGGIANLGPAVAKHKHTTQTSAQRSLDAVEPVAALRVGEATHQERYQGGGGGGTLLAAIEPGYRAPGAGADSTVLPASLGAEGHARYGPRQSQDGNTSITALQGVLAGSARTCVGVGRPPPSTSSIATASTSNDPFRGGSSAMTSATSMQVSPAGSAVTTRPSDHGLVTREWLPPLAPRNWTVLKEVGDGSFGTVWLADWHSPLYVPDGNRAPGPSSRPEYRGKRIVAIKRMKKAFEGGWDECMQLKELKSLRQIPMHANVIPLYDAFLLPTTRELYFVFECMEGNLYQLTKSRRGRPIAAALFASIFFQISAGLAHVHDNGYFHRDLKPENLLITTTGLTDYPSSLINAPPGAPKEKDVIVLVKLADFGLAREIASAPPYTEYVSTRWYRAPEVLLRSRDYSAPVDMWALGCILLEVLTLKPLFPGDSEVDQVFKICETLGDPANDYGTEEDGNPRGGGVWRRGIKMATRQAQEQFVQIPPRQFATLFDRSTMTPVLIDSIHKMLRYDPASRITATALLDHEFFRETARRFGPNIAVNLPPGTDPYAPEPIPQPVAHPTNGAAGRSVSTLDLSAQRPTSQISERSIPPSHSVPLGKSPAPPFAQTDPTRTRPNGSAQSPIPVAARAPQAVWSNGNGSTSPAVMPPPAHPALAAMPAPQRPADSQSIRSMPETILSARITAIRNGLDGRPIGGGPLQRVSSYAPSIAASTYYDGSIFEGAAPGRAASILSFPLSDSGLPSNGPVAGPSGFNTYRSQSPAPSSIYSQAAAVPLRVGSANPLKRAPSDASLSSMRLQTPPETGFSDEEDDEPTELDRFVLSGDPDEDEENPKDRARAVMQKKTSLRGAADPLHNFTLKNEGEEDGDGGSIFSHSGRSFTSSFKGKGRSIMSERMPQIIEDTSRLHVSSPPAGRSAATSSGGFNRHKTRRRDGNDDVHSVLSVESGRSAPAWTFSIPGGRGRTYSVSSKATSASDPERRQRPGSDFLGPGEQPARLQSVSSLPDPRLARPQQVTQQSSHRTSMHAPRAAPPSTGHSSIDASLAYQMQGRASLVSRDQAWRPELAQAAREARSPHSPRSVSASRSTSPYETRHAGFSGVSSNGRPPVPSLPPIQSFDTPPATQHPILKRQGTGAASIASFRSTPGTMPSYFAAPDRPSGPPPAVASATTYHLPYLPAMDMDPPARATASPVPLPPSLPLSPAPTTSFTFQQQAPLLAPIVEPPQPSLTPEHLPPG